MTGAVLALDIGSSSVRGAVFDAAGERRQLAGRSYAHRADRGAAGVFPAAGIALVLREVLHELDLTGVRHVAVSSLWHSLLGIDQDGAPCTDVYTWEASAPDATLDTLAEHLDLLEYRRRTGSYFHASYPLAAWWYLRQQQVTAHRWSDLPGWLMAEVLGVEGGWSVDIAAGSGMWNQDLAEWDAPTAHAVGVDLSSLGAPWRESRPTGPRARTFGLEDAVVIPPYGDGVCNSIGIGAVGPTVSALTAGTSGSLRVLLDGDAPHAPFGLWRYRLDDYTGIGGAVSNAGNLLHWIRGTLGVDDPLAFAAGEPPAFDGLVAQPHFAGERGPGYSRSATGALDGLRLHHTRSDIAHALVFSLLATYRQLTELTLTAVPTVSSFIAAGGILNARPEFAQLLADATGQPVYPSDADESSLAGAALRARGRVAAWPSREPLLPRPEWTSAIAERMNP
ncbi:FGGY-family carbohydrate kinase [Agromyces silvae]|uniref:FGGY-family carbohydrate kinase n=1 Tax=Agromyces silvae TaxID=3388266 RepID=UPI00280C185B|nr:FGGY-family carbohydrate kinase [Agromyces protaetiae]